MGLESEKARLEEAERMVSWALRQFVEKTVAEEGRHFGEVPVWLGDRNRVGLVAGEELSVLLPATQPPELDAQIVYRGPLEAPIEEGEQVAELVIPRADLPEARLPLVADRDVPEGGFIPRVRTAALVLLNRAWGEAQALR